MLVLGVGGLVGEAWMTGFLAGMEERTGFDLRGADAYVGTSAGSIVAATLVAGVSPRRPDPLEALRTHETPRRRLDAAFRRARRASFEASYPLANLAINVTAPAVAVARAAFLASLPPGSRSMEELRHYVSELGCEFDGRLRDTNRVGTTRRSRPSEIAIEIPICSENVRRKADLFENVYRKTIEVVRNRREKLARRRQQPAAEPIEPRQP